MNSKKLLKNVFRGQARGGVFIWTLLIQQKDNLRTVEQAVAIAVLATLILGFLPGTWFDIVRQATLQGVQALAGG